MPKTKRWRNTQKIEWMTDKVADDDYDDYKVIPWIASSKSSDQKSWFEDKAVGLNWTVHIFQILILVTLINW